MKTTDLFEAPEKRTKTVPVDPSRTQLSKGADAFTAACDMGGFSAKQKREICEAVYRTMVGNP